MHSAAWAGDLWVFAMSPQFLALMIDILQQCARYRMGLQLRHERCKWPEAKRADQEPGHTQKDSEALRSLRSMEPVPNDGCMKVWEPMYS